MADNVTLPRRPAHRRRLSETDLDDATSGPKRNRERAPGEVCCSRCRLMFSENGLKALSSVAGFGHLTYAECAASASKGCEVCIFIIDTIEKRNEHDWAGDDTLTFWNRPSGKIADSPPSFIDTLEGRLPSGVVVITIYPYAEEGNPFAALIHRRPLQRDVKSKRILSAARRLFSECKKSHAQCRYSRDTVLPSRVLDVGTVQSPTLRLFVNSTEEHGEYLALSYCWGGPQKSLLRRGTLTSMTSDIRPESLQRTVRDAVAVTRRLGFRYLWVDALCIIQDCSSDKEKEISKMAKIYKNAAMTLAAGTAVRAGDGFLDMEKTYLPKDRFVVPLSNGEKGAVYLRAGAHIPKHALDERGWVLQEFLLSSRMLVFSEYELLWQCKGVELRGVTDSSLEYLQPLEGLPWKVFNEDAESNLGDEATESNFGNEDTEKRYIWKTIVQQYTHRDLGVKDDRLNALKGITRELETLWRDSNKFGLWTRWFVELLAWSKRDCDGEWEMKRERRAPSWSWASLNGRIRYTEMFERVDAAIQDANLLEARVSRHVVLSCRVLRDEDIDPSKFDEEEGEDKWLDECYDLDESVDEAGERSVQYLLLGTIKRGFGVALMAVEAPGGFYQRVGLATFQDVDAWKDIGHRNIKLQ